MPHLRSLQGIKLLRNYVDNWSSVLMVYANMKKQTTVRFKDGSNIDLRNDDILQFYGELYKRYLLDRGFKYLEDNNKIIIQTPQGFKIRILDKVNLHVIDEIFIMNVYGKHKLNNRIVLDIGCSYGDSSIFFISEGAKLVYGYEIDDNRYKLARENIEMNGLQDRIRVINRSATYQEINDLLTNIGQADIFMKVDCEGCEYDLFQGLNYSGIKEIVLEYHGDPNSLLSNLRKAGFESQRKGEIIFAARSLSSIGL